MIKAEALQPMDIEFNILKENDTRTERIWLTKNQFEVLEIVARALDQSISEYITETIYQCLNARLTILYHGS